MKGAEQSLKLQMTLAKTLTTGFLGPLNNFYCVKRFHVFTVKRSPAHARGYKFIRELSCRYYVEIGTVAKLHNAKLINSNLIVI